MTFRLTHDDVDWLAAKVAEKIIDRLRAEKIGHQWMTAEEAMEMMRIKSPRTLYQKIEDGLIYGKKDGRRWMIKRASIEEYLADNWT